jgi:hypothetical protein
MKKSKLKGLSFFLDSVNFDFTGSSKHPNELNKN